MGEHEMDDEQRRRMHDLKRLAWREGLFGGAILGISIVAGVYLRDDWTAFLVAGSLSLAVTIVVCVSHWRYIRRGPFPRLPASMRPPRNRRRGGVRGVTSAANFPVVRRWSRRR